MTSTVSLTTTEDIIKYQQELMNFQRNQKEVQKETIKLLGTLNKTLSLMLDRLDDFAMKTNIKLEETNQNQNQNNNSPDTIYITTDSITNSINNICNNVNNSLSNLNHTNNMNNNMNNKSELIFINDLTPTNFLDMNNNNNNHNNNNTNHLQNNTLFINNNHLNTSNNSNNQNSNNNINGNHVIKLNNLNSPMSTKEMPSLKVKDEESNNQQRFFNKFVRESVEKRLGKDFLLFHEIQEIDQNIMEEIKREALQAYPPVHIRPRRAWHLAKASLRCRRRSLKRQKERQVVSNNTNSVSSLSVNSSTSSTATPNNNQSTTIANMI